MYISVVIQARVTAEADRGVEREIGSNDTAVAECGGKKQNDGRCDAGRRKTTGDFARRNITDEFDKVQTWQRTA